MSAALGWTVSDQRPQCHLTHCGPRAVFQNGTTPRKSTGAVSAQRPTLLPVLACRVTKQACSHDDDASSFSCLMPSSIDHSSCGDRGSAAVSRSSSTASTACPATPMIAYRSNCTSDGTAKISCGSVAASGTKSMDEVDAQTVALHLENGLLKAKLQRINAHLKHQQHIVRHLLKQLEKERERRCKIEDAMLESCSCLGPGT
mmetsp:Transcript_44382/g.87981  ORF Transcript_44382/g.87981 Transcript_44382/m.87981 type:complete len:202 (+) Transcript_44382:51-656(+)